MCRYSDQLSRWAASWCFLFAMIILSFSQLLVLLLLYTMISFNLLCRMAVLLLILWSELLLCIVFIMHHDWLLACSIIWYSCWILNLNVFCNLFFLVYRYSFIAYVWYLWVLLITIPVELSSVKTVPVCAWLHIWYFYAGVSFFWLYSNEGLGVVVFLWAKSQQYENFL